MKTLASVLLLFSFATISAWAEDIPGGKASLQVRTGKKGSEQIAAPGPKVPAKPAEPRFHIGGVLGELARGKKLAKPINLRYPPRPSSVSDNAYTDPQSGTIKGFVLFAIKF